MIELTEQQKECKHRALSVRVSAETYSKYGKTFHKVEVVCPDCGVCVARAGEVWFNRRMTIYGILDEHWPKLLLQPGMKKD